MRLLLKIPPTAIAKLLDNVILTSEDRCKDKKPTERYR